LAALLFSQIRAQQPGTNTPEVHPKLSSSTCTKGGCTTQATSLVLDSNWRWAHKVGDYVNCYTGNTWDATICPDGLTCAKNCAIDGADYAGTYGITVAGNALTIKFVTHGQYGDNIGSRSYLLDETGSKYRMYNLKNKEFTFTVDVSKLPCGLNGALYFVEMDADGGMSKYPSNTAGAKYGTGYCDAQCPHDMKFINGEANVKEWKPNPKDKNSGSGFYGTCCVEMDIWEANSMATAYTPHPCNTKGQQRCSGKECGDSAAGERYDGLCDKDGCDFNSYRLGNTSFVGPSKTVDTTKPVTVVTQFITSDGTDAGDLVEIRRIYVQNGVKYENSFSSVPGINSTNSVSDKFCSEQKSTFKDKNDFANKGGLKALGKTLERGMVLVMSLWDDHDVNMLWLDSSYPTNVPPSNPGVTRGPCSTDSGKPEDVEKNFPNSQVTFSDVKVGEIGSTF